MTFIRLQRAPPARLSMAWQGGRRGIAVVAALIVGAGRAIAGPPYVTDDPEPTDTGHWEDYAFVTGTHTPGETQGQGGIELNDGAATDLQLSASIPIDYAAAGGDRAGRGDLGLGAKYRFLHQSDDGWMPDVAFFPQVNLPTANRRFGTGHASWFLPLWAQKDFGQWSTFGGGGYAVNPGAGNRNSWLYGWAVTHDVSERLNLGAEIYHQTAAADGARALTVLALGVIYHLNDNFSLLASGGPGIQNARQGGEGEFYAALELTY